MSLPTSVPGVVEVELFGAAAHDPPDLDVLIEVPHGADRAAHYAATRALLKGALPEDLQEFFFVNTDVGAWQIGRRVAELLAARGRRAMVLRCALPRTFVDCNRVEDAEASAGMTAGIAAYLHDAADRDVLSDLRRRYLEVVEGALGCLKPGGFLLMPHTYGPVTLGIASVDDDIVNQLRWAHEPERLATWPLRPEVDMITRTADGVVQAAPAVAESVAAAYRADGLNVGDNETYHLHPSTIGLRWSLRLPGRTLCLEVRRDLLCPEWTWNRENRVASAAVERFAAPIARAIGDWLA